MRLTDKQMQLLTIIAKGNDAAGPCDLDEILERVQYDTSKQSLQFSIRALVAKGLIVKMGIYKRRGRQRQVIDMTQLGRDAIGIKRAEKPHYVAAPEDDDLDQQIETLEDV